MLLKMLFFWLVAVCGTCNSALLEVGPQVHGMEMSDQEAHQQSVDQSEEGPLADEFGTREFDALRPFFVDRRLFPRALLDDPSAPLEDGVHFEVQRSHLRYLMSSTAEQPDNSCSSLSLWLTLLIAATAAAILA